MFNKAERSKMADNEEHRRAKEKEEKQAKIDAMISGSRVTVTKWLLEKLTIKHYDDDWIDRLIWHWTPVIIMCLLVLSRFMFLWSDSIQCWCPVHFSDYQQFYTNEICWVSNTYHLSFDDYIPREEEHEKREYVQYYQYVPWILCVQAVLLFLPHRIWRYIYPKYGLHVGDFIEKGCCLRGPPPPVVEKMLQKLEDKSISPNLHVMACKHLERMHNRFLRALVNAETDRCSIQNVVNRMCCFLIGSTKCSLFVTYILIKLLSLLTILGQLFVLNWVLGIDYHVFGMEVIERYLAGEDWTESAAFPRVTMCDFKVRRIGNLQRYTVQCVLPVNLWNEKIYLFLYFWFILLAALTLASLLYWFCRAASTEARQRYIAGHLLISQVTEADEEKRCAQQEALRNFTKELGVDGTFVFMLLSLNVNRLATADLMLESCRRFCLRNYKPISNRPEIGRLCRVGPFSDPDSSLVNSHSPFLQIPSQGNRA